METGRALTVVGWGMWCFQSANNTSMEKCERYRLVGLVVKASASRAEDPGFQSRLRRDFSSGSSHASDLKTGTPVATLPGAWRYRVSAGTGRPGVSILWLGEMESLICNFYGSVAARKTVWADPSLRYTHVAGTLSSQQANCERLQADCLPGDWSKGLLLANCGNLPLG